MPSNTKNVLRTGTDKKSKKPFIITGIVLGVMFISIMIYATYIYNCYCYINSVTEADIKETLNKSIHCKCKLV